MKLFKKPRSPFWWYDFYFGGKRYRASTGEKSKAAAGAFAAKALASLTEGNPAHQRGHKAPTLREFSVRFLAWAENSHTLKPNTRKFYVYGWRLLSYSPLASMPIDQITSETIDTTVFRRPVINRRSGKETDEIVVCSRTYSNQALRTLKVMLGKAKEWKVLRDRTSFTVPKASGRDCLIRGEAEAAMERELTGNKHRHQAWLVMMIMQDTGMRPSEVFEIRLENVHWAERRIFIPEGKSEKARRFVGISERMHHGLSTWCQGSEGPGWLFPSRNKNSKTGHITTIAGSFKSARDRAGISQPLVPYSARHTYGTYTMKATGNLFAVADSMGHSSVESMKPYQHQETDQLLVAINERNATRGASTGAGHTFGHTSSKTASNAA